MKTIDRLRRKTALLLAGFLFATPAGALAQETAAPPESETEETAETEDYVRLSPFVVTGEDDVGYAATSTLGGTRIRSSMKDIGASISIVNKEFLTDTNSIDIQDVLLFTPNTEVGGLAGNYSGSQEAGAGNLIPEIERDNQRGGVTRIRGLAGADLTRNYFITNVPFDTYNVDRIEVQRGANSALFGLGSPGGIVNHTTIIPDFLRNRSRIRLETDDNGTFRSSFRTNQVLSDRLAVRIAGLYSDKQFEQKEAFEEDRRLYAALNFKVTENIHIFGNVEFGQRDRSAVDFVPPNDGISPWLKTGKPIFDSPAQGGNVFRRNGDFLPGVNNNLIYTLISSGSSSGFVNIYGDPNNPAPTFGGQVFARRGLGLSNPFPDTPGEWMMLQPRNAFDIVRRTGFYPDGTPVGPGEAGFFVRGNVGQQILDRSIFDYRKHLFSGGSAQQQADWKSFQIGAEGSWFEDRFGVELSYSDESMDTSGQNSLQGVFQRTIYIDTNRFLLGTTDGTADGPLIPNPSFGQPVMGGLWGGNDFFTDMISYRGTAFAEIKATDFMEEGLASSILGRLKLTGLFERRETNAGESFSRDKIDYNAVANATAGGRIADVPAVIFRTGSQFVLPTAGGVDFFNATTLADVAGAGIGAVPFGKQRNRSPVNGSYTGWDLVGQSFVDFNAQTYNLQDNFSSPASFFSGKSAEQIDSQVLVGQYYVWDDTIVLLGSWRNDKASSASVGAPGSTLFPRSENVFDPAFLAGPGNLEEDANEDTTQWSIMVHTPQFLKDYLPWGTEISVYYSEASNFQPSPGSVTVLNDPIAPVTGSTTEKGFIVSTMNGKLSGRFNWYETGILNRRFDVGGVSANEGILLNLARQLDNPDNVSQGFTQADVEAVLPPQGVIDVNQYVPDFPNAEAETNRNSFDNGTQDFVSKGYEFEINYNPIPRWTMLASVGYQQTITSNTYPVLKKYAADFVTPTWVNSDFAQNYFINDDSTETLAEVAQRSILDPVARGVLQDGSPQIEQRKLRINFNTSYNIGRDSFVPDWLGNVTVGGGARWQDQVGVGFGVSQNESGGYVQDIEKPIYGGELFNVDLFFRTSYEIGDSQSLILQINIKDAFATGDLVPIYANPDGSKVYRFMEGRLITASATFEF